MPEPCEPYYVLVRRDDLANLMGTGIMKPDEYDRLHAAVTAADLRRLADLHLRLRELTERVAELEHVVGLVWAAGYEDQSEKWMLGVIYEALEKLPDVDKLAERASASIDDREAQERKGDPS